MTRVKSCLAKFSEEVSSNACNYMLVIKIFLWMHLSKILRQTLICSAGVAFGVFY